MGSSTQDTVRARGGRRFKLMSAMDGDRVREILVPKPPARKTVDFMRGNGRKTPQMRVKLGSESVSSLDRPSAVSVLGDSRVPLLISRNNRHSLRRSQVLPAIGTQDSGCSVHEHVVMSSQNQKYSARFPLPDEPPLSSTCVTVGLRLLDGRRVERRFHENDKLGSVVCYAEEVSGGSLPGCCELLVGGLAEKCLGESELEMTLKQLEIRNRTLLYLQERDDDG